MNCYRIEFESYAETGAGRTSHHGAIDVAARCEEMARRFVLNWLYREGWLASSLRIVMVVGG